MFPNSKPTPPPPPPPLLDGKFESPCPSEESQFTNYGDIFIDYCQGNVFSLPWDLQSANARAAHGSSFFSLQPTFTQSQSWTERPGGESGLGPVQQAGRDRGLA